MDSAQAQIVIESLRKGIPPNRFVRHFTVGRKTEIYDLTKRLQTQDGTVLLLKANYGSGKTHLLKYIREEALGRHYAVSVVTLDSSSAIRFNRMDQVFGAVCRNIEIPQVLDNKGLLPFFNFLVDSMSKREDSLIWREISNNWKWDFSEVLDSQAVFVGLRAWATRKTEATNIVEDWFYQPWQYKTQRKKLYHHLVENLRTSFRDSRQYWKFCEDDVFSFHTQGYAQSWAGLRDFDRLARAAGLKGLIILFDEYEDIITNLKNISYQETAFWNLFRFYNGKAFPGKTFYAVTPEFVEKCKRLLSQKRRWDFDFSRFDALPTYEMSPLTEPELEELAMRILEAHGIAYNWEPDLVMKASHLRGIISKATSLQIQDRARHVIKSIVQALDELLQESL